ncbi:hypothetical protein SLS62_008772 [Diatrype stigma]|uniref:Aminoglycoside phosphotransferase domain-containing protein n=1 Tax=Diatrype stigma TaxID=117547 RepID=A0AAN9YL68_9PEZI
MAEPATQSHEFDEDTYDLFGDGEASQNIDFDKIFDDEEATTPPPQSQPSAHVPSENTTVSDAATPASTATSFTSCPYDENPQHGLGWQRETFSLTPVWGVKPTIESIIETLKTRVGRDMTYHVKHWRDGRYNKFYLVSFQGCHCVMKVTLPICPALKTESEVATLEWIHRNTALPVPKVKCYDSSRNNPVGFEWILMDRIEGGPLSECWDNIPDGSLERIVKQIAHYATAAFEKQFSSGGICNIYPPAPDSDDPRPGELVWMPFFWGERGYLGYPRGPFRDVRSWNESRLQFAYSNLTTTMQFMRRSYDERRDWKVGSRMLKLINRVRLLGHALYPKAGAAEAKNGLDPGQESRDGGNYGEGVSAASTRVPPVAAAAAENAPEPEPEPTMLWHDNLSLDNIFVDSSFVLTGILDWECVSCLPLAQACQLPAFLQMRGAADTERPYAAPTEDSYIDDDFELTLPARAAFRRDRRQYAISACRRVFLREMRRRSPQGWLATYRRRRSADQRDFEAAVQHCDNEFAYERVERWMDALKRGKAPGEIEPRLHEKLYSD